MEIYISIHKHSVSITKLFSFYYYKKVQNLYKRANHVKISNLCLLLQLNTKILNTIIIDDYLKILCY